MQDAQSSSASGTSALVTGKTAIDASRSSILYSGNKVQPSALQALPCIRI